MLVVFFIVRALWQTRRRFMQTRPDIVHLATALLLGIFGYFGTALFLHLSYQRYYWFLMALAAAAIRIFDLEAAASAPQGKNVIKGDQSAESEAIPHK
jgi:hypothetical protein